MSDDYKADRDPSPATDNSSDKYASLLEDARENATRDNELLGDSFRAEQDDQQFLVGNQWDPDDVAERNDADLVTLTINDLGQFLDQVVGDELKHPIQTKFVPADFGASKQKFVSTTGREYPAHEVRAGLIRQIEFKCNATRHYSLAGQHAAETGRGWLRVYSDYPDAGFEQCLYVERIKNRWSVLYDAMAEDPLYADMGHCFVGAWMPNKMFSKLYPDALPGLIGPNDNARYWFGRTGYTRIAEYYWREQFTDMLLQLDNGNVIRQSEGHIYEAARVSGHVIAQRKIKSWKVKWTKLTYNNVLEKPQDIPGSTIPLVPVLGKVIEGTEDDFVYGLFRFAKQPKMMENYWLSSATQRISQMPNSPWLVTDRMVEGKTGQWRDANRGAPAYLTFNADGDAPQGPQRIQPAQIPIGEMQMIMAFGDKVKASVGFHDAAIGNARNKQSGIAIQRLQQESDTGSFVFQNGLREAVARVGRIMNDWMPVIYDTARFITVRAPNGEIDTIEINKVGPDGYLMNDMGSGNFDVHAEAGQEFSTLREEGAEKGLELMTSLSQVGDGQAVGSIADIVVENMDFPGADRMSKRLRKMVPPNLLDPMEMTEEERKAPPPPPSPQEQAQAAEAKSAIMDAEAKQATAAATMKTADATVATAHADTLKATLEIAQTLNPPPAAPPGGAQGSPAAGGTAVKATPGKLPPETEQLISELVLNTLASALSEAQPPQQQQQAPPPPAQPPTPQGAPPNA